MPVATDFPSQLAEADRIDRNARTALSQALKNVEPLSAETHALFLTMPEKYATCLRQVATIIESLPALRTAAAEAAAELAPLVARACSKCQGSGRYQAPTTHLTRGQAVC